MVELSTPRSFFRFFFFFFFCKLFLLRTAISQTTCFFHHSLCKHVPVFRQYRKLAIWNYAAGVLDIRTPSILPWKWQHSFIKELNVDFFRFVEVWMKKPTCTSLFFSFFLFIHTSRTNDTPAMCTSVLSFIPHQNEKKNPLSVLII